MNDKELEAAVAELFRLNNYDVDGPLQIAGASVDLRAQPRADPFANPIYIEVTISQVGNDKYSKDLSKFAKIHEVEPQATCLIVSSKGFSQPVAERAPNWIQCLTYGKLAERFERFTPYQRATLDEGSLADELRRLADIYEPPSFEMDGGRLEPALETLEEWCLAAGGEQGWLIVVGEYGTGKTALTQMLHRRLMAEHRRNPAAPIPVRIELRDFTKQFDADSLLHKFLDDNQLGHVPLFYFSSLISRGRVVLLLDGYDEMAQYMHLLERRGCLEALARLGRDGARGVLTSRPNYFSEAEELNVLETLYTSLSGHGVLAMGEYVAEAALDKLFERQFIDRQERRLQDLDEDQTEALVRRKLEGRAEQVDVVLELLKKVSRSSDDGLRALGGKPVIISYIVALADELSSDDVATEGATVSEYQCFRMIVDQLMARDQKRSPSMPKASRREFLQRMAVRLSKSDLALFGENEFLELIDEMFAGRLDRLQSSERQNDRMSLLADLRSSATLTRISQTGQEGWRFSHNSLREFLVVEYLLQCLAEEKVPQDL